MKKAAAVVSFVIAAVLLLTVCVSFASAVSETNKRMSPDAIKADTDAALAGKEVVEPADNSLSGFALTALGLSGGAFLVAGFALWPRKSN